MQYDLFLSHRSENKPWVEVLAHNLKARGYRVFLDSWELIPGGSLGAQLDAALANSRAGVLVATPESLESGWVREEYEKMLVLKNRTPIPASNPGNVRGFTILPLTFGDVPNFPFLANALYIDFSDPTPDGYRRAFYRLLCGLEGAPPGDLSGHPFGEACNLPTSLAIPKPMVPDLPNMEPQPLAGGETAFLDEVFDYLDQRQPVLLLAQAGRDRMGIHQAILARAACCFGEENGCHVAPPSDPELPSADYLAAIAPLAGLAAAEISDGISLENALAERLRAGPLFLLITRLHTGSAAGRRALAGILRSLTEREETNRNLHLVLSGSEGLAALRFADGQLSLLSNTTVLYWPEPTADDLCNRQDAGSSLPPTEAEHLLARTGGHPQLLQKCLRQWTKDRNVDCERLIRRDPDLAALFVRYRDEWAGDAGRLRDWLKRECIAPYRCWPADELLRRLYWDNLLVERDDQFAWRCPAIRAAFLREID